ncbi:superinfection immunity protein [Pelagibacterium montanilacus]|uniref:superinfection immunity protein n=1 Tax=Pelagibacterium montanilacus TaxID=2185280 RepID=UPI000F8D74DA|nr:superinfection immunity protein [Pelagibacterium montanilacus]
MRPLSAHTLPLALAFVLLPVAPAMAQSTNDLLLIFGLLYGALFIIYVIPTVVAFYRGHPNRWIILIINFAFGATVLGWLIAMVWAMGAVHRTRDPDGTNGGESGLNIFANDVKRLRIEGINGVNPAAAAPLAGDGPAPSPERPSEPDPLAQIARLKQLRTEGLLSESEFTRLKGPLIDRYISAQGGTTT